MSYKLDKDFYPGRRVIGIRSKQEVVLFIGYKVSFLNLISLFTGSVQNDNFNFLLVT